MSAKELSFNDDPLWFKDVVIYELHVKTFCDSNGDGIGDFKGLVQKLDYLQDLGITAIWLLPFYPSPLRDDGYDIADYFNINPNYGTLRDFKNFLKEAHRREIRVITELVLNHTSDQHAWFQKSRRSQPGSTWRNYYVWNDSPEKYQDARVIFKDFESSNWAWDPVAKQYYWHRFYSHQPDLNYESPHLRKAVRRVLDFWLEMGVDGLRLDAVPYLFEREGTNCENLPETYAFLRKLRRYIDGKYKDKIFIAEANQWPEDAVAYFGESDICQMAFHFPLMPRMFMALQMEDCFPIVDILEQTPSIPDSCQWGMFLRNHDELTLEMVTDEERDYMFRIFARETAARINLGIRRRLAPLLESHRRKIELMNVLLFTLPGTPIIYYGDEIGMGDNYYLGDRDGVRTPMQWSSDRNAGFSMANPQKLYLPVIIDPAYHYEAVNVENQQVSHSSLLWWMKHSIAMRNRFKAFGRGSLEFLRSDNPKILAYVRQYEDEKILVVVNLSKHSQAVDFDLSEFAGHIPQEVFSNNAFPIIKKIPYMLTLAPFGYYLFLLLKKEGPVLLGKEELPDIRVEGNWEKIFEGKALEKLLGKILPAYMKERRWFGGKSRAIRQVVLEDRIPLPEKASHAHLLIVKVRYSEGPSERYSLPVSFAFFDRAGGETAEKFMKEGVKVGHDPCCPKTKAERILEESPESVIGRVYVNGEDGVVFDGLFHPVFREKILEIILRRRKAKGTRGEVASYKGKRLKQFPGGQGVPLKSNVLKTEQSNTSIIYEDTFFFKWYRKISEGINPDMEILRFLTEKTEFSNIPPFAGSIEYRKSNSEPEVIGILQGLVQNQGDGWGLTLNSVTNYFERILSTVHEAKDMPERPASFFDVDPSNIPIVIQELIGGAYLEMVLLLGKRTAEFHMAVSKATEDPAFAPEPFSLLYQRSLYQSLRSLTKKIFQSFEGTIGKLSKSIRVEAREVLSSEKEILGRYMKIMKEKITATKTRIHGDYHLGQVLFTGRDFVIIDFEGEPARAPSERRLKRSPLVDVAGMMRSFQYAAYAALFLNSSFRPGDISELESWIPLWYHCVSSVFFHSYRETAGDVAFVPKAERDLNALLEVFLLEKAVYELGYELNNRPDWLIIPVKGIQDILKTWGDSPDEVSS